MQPSFAGLAKFTNVGAVVNNGTLVGSGIVWLQQGGSESGNPVELQSIFTKMAAWPGVSVQFGPELSGKGPRMHCMIFEPGGIRIEFVCDP